MSRQPQGRNLRRVDFHAPRGGFPDASCAVCDRSPAAVMVMLRVAAPPRARTTAARSGHPHHFCRAHLGVAGRLLEYLARPGGDPALPDVDGEPIASALPLRLPTRFVEDIGFGGPDRFVGMYWLAGANLLVAYGASSTPYHQLHPAPWREFLERPLVAHWLREHGAQLGSPRGTATHHLVVDRSRETAFLAWAADARLLVMHRAVEDSRW